MANCYFRIRVDGLCYDTSSVEAMPFLIDIPDTLPRPLVVRLLSGKTFVIRLPQSNNERSVSDAILTKALWSP